METYYKAAECVQLAYDRDLWQIIVNLIINLGVDKSCEYNGLQNKC
jgi:hypothetical protein